MTLSGYKSFEDLDKFNVPDWKCPAKLCYADLDLVLVFDASSSVDASGWKIMKQFARNITSHFAIGPEYTQVGIVSFGNNATVVTELESNKSNLNNLILSFFLF